MVWIDEKLMIHRAWPSKISKDDGALMGPKRTRKSRPRGSSTAVARVNESTWSGRPGRLRSKETLPGSLCSAMSMTFSLLVTRVMVQRVVLRLCRSKSLSICF